MEQDTPIRLIALDLDGTTLAPDQTLPEGTARVLRQALEQGVEIVICTGRNLLELRNIQALLPEVRYYAGANGGFLWDKQENTFLLERPLSFSLQLEIMERLCDIDGMLELHTLEHVYCGKDCLYDGSPYLPGWLMPTMYRTRTPVEDIRGFITQRGREGLKINYFFPHPEERSRAAERIADLPLDLSSSVACNLECNPRSANKGEALQRLTQHLGLSRQQVMAVGDSSNDLTMLQYAGLPVAMGNALEEVKSICRAVTGTNAEEGVAQAIEKYVLSKER